ncbi:MAG: pentapeptide repeat-containing protein [Elainellaceae cyanobacterium]
MTIADSDEERSSVNTAGILPPRLRSKSFQRPPLGLIVIAGIVIMSIGFATGNLWISFAGAIVALLVSLRVIWIDLRDAVIELMSPRQRTLTISFIGLIAASIGLLRITGWADALNRWYARLNWDAVGATGEVIGAVGQILIAILAVYVAWRQYVISKDLTIQQNIITQQQTIDSYFQGISELVLDEEGLLEDLPLERAIAEGRTAAILSSVDANGKAKVLRFLSRSRLLTPLKRDGRLGRAILDGTGGYAEDREYGIRVVDLGVMLAGANLAGTDLRWTDLSNINLLRVDLNRADLVKANFSRSILYEADLAGADLMGTRLFYGAAATATPRTKDNIPNYTTGEFTGTVIENADFTGAQRLSEEQRYYCCAWGGSATRATIPGGCEGIPNLLGR